MLIAFLAATVLVQPAAQPAPQAATDAAAPAGVARIRPSPGLVQAYQAWGGCLDTGVNGTPAEEAAPAAAKRVIAGCDAELKAMTAAGESWIAGLNLPAAQQTQLREKMAQETDGLEQRVATRILQLRAPARPAVVGR